MGDGSGAADAGMGRVQPHQLLFTSYTRAQRLLGMGWAERG